jgi:aspartyl-tRNA synthetase
LPKAAVTPIGSFPRIAYDDAILRYGSDKPDLRNPILISDVSHHFTTSGFGLFEKIVGTGGVVRAIPAPNTADKSRKFFDEMNEWARSEGHAGLGYVTRKGGEFGGPIAKNHGTEGMEKLYAELGLGATMACSLPRARPIRPPSWQARRAPASVRC